MSSARVLPVSRNTHRIRLASRAAPRAPSKATGTRSRWPSTHLGEGSHGAHQALSLNAIIANRANGTFSSDPYKAVDELIEYTLEKLAEN